MSNPSLVEFKEAIITIKDGSATPKTFTLELGEGTFQYVENTELVTRRRRGKLWAVKEGDEQPVEVSFQADLNAITSTDSTPTLMEVLKGTGAAATAGWTTTGGACEPYAIDIEIEIPNTDCDAAVADEIYSLPEFRTSSRTVVFNDATIAIQGMCNTTDITSTRPAIV